MPRRRYSPSPLGRLPIFATKPPPTRKRKLSEVPTIAPQWDISTKDVLQSTGRRSKKRSSRRSEWNPKICDVRFRVKCAISGDYCEIASAKTLLSIHSDVFAAMFFGAGDFKSMSDDSLDGTQIVEITDCSKEAMETVNAYVFHRFDSAVLTPQNIGEVLYASTKYCIGPLKKGCEDYLKDVAEAKEDSELVAALHSLDKWQMKDTCAAVISDIRESDLVLSVLKCQQTAELMPGWLLLELLKEEDIADEEMESLFTILHKWATYRKKEVERSDGGLDESSVSDTNATMGVIMAPFIKYIDFETMDFVFFSESVCAVKGLLTDKRLLELFQEIAKRTKKEREEEDDEDIYDFDYAHLIISD